MEQERLIKRRKKQEEKMRKRQQKLSNDNNHTIKTNQQQQKRDKKHKKEKKHVEYGSLRWRIKKEPVGFVFMILAVIGLIGVFAFLANDPQGVSEPYTETEVEDTNLDTYLEDINQDVANWDTSDVTDLTDMFHPDGEIGHTPNVSIESPLVVVNDSGVFKLVTSDKNGTFYGYIWNGTAWAWDPSIVAGLTNSGVTFNSTRTVIINNTQTTPINDVLNTTTISLLDFLTSTPMFFIFMLIIIPIVISKFNRFNGYV